LRWLRHLLVLPPIAFGIAVLAYAVINRQPPARAPVAERAEAVKVIEIVEREVTPWVKGYGTVAPARSWHAVAQVGGRVVELDPAFEPGETVREGQTLIRLAPDDHELAVVRAEASIAAADARLAELRVQAGNLEASLMLEREALILAERELARQEALSVRGTVSQAVLDTARREMLAQRLRIQELDNQQRLIPEQRRSLEQQRALAEADLARAQLDLARTELRTPFRGRVASTAVELSQYVMPGTTMGIVDGIDRAEVDAQFATIPLRNFAALAFGDGAAIDGSTDAHLDFETIRQTVEITAEVRLAAPIDEARWPAELLRLSSQIDPQTRAVGFIVGVEEPYTDIRPGRRPPLVKGMFVEVVLRGPAAAGRIAVPRAAVRDGRALIVDADDRLALRAIDVAAVIGDLAVVERGLDGGDRLVTSDLSPAIPGMLLRPTVDDALSARLDDWARGP